MARNGSGTYTLPAGNPVVTGTTISSTTHNTTMTDIETALTGSVAADGQTVMSGALDLNGSNLILSADATNYIDGETSSVMRFLVGGVAKGQFGDATGTAFVVNNDQALEKGMTVIHSGTTAFGIDLQADSVTTSNALEINADALTTGAGIHLKSSSASTSTRNLVFIENTGAAATATTLMRLDQDAPQTTLKIDYSGDSSGDPTFWIDKTNRSAFAPTMWVDSVQDSGVAGLYVNMPNIGQAGVGYGITLYTDTISTATNELLSITNDSSAATGTRLINLDQDADGPFINFEATPAASTTAAVSTNTTSGSTTHHIQVQIDGTKAWIAASTTNPS